jgi:hypothetical protein
MSKTIDRKDLMIGARVLLKDGRSGYITHFKDRGNVTIRIYRMGWDENMKLSKLVSVEDISDMRPSELFQRRNKHGLV